MNNCEYCQEAKPLVIGQTDDCRISIQYPNTLNAYGYDVQGFGSNGISVKISYCPMCGRRLR